MPQMGVSVAEGTIVEWRKRPGDWVEADEPICDVTTDKIDVEIPAPASGRIEAILVEPGATVAVGTPLARIDAEAKPGGAPPAGVPPPAPLGPGSTRSPTGAGRPRTRARPAGGGLGRPPPMRRLRRPP